MTTTTSRLTFTRTDNLIEATDADANIIATIEVITEVCWDGRERVADYYAEMAVDGTEESMDGFPVRNGRNTRTYEGVTAQGQLAAAKAWVRHQLTTVAR